MNVDPGDVMRFGGSIDQCLERTKRRRGRAMQGRSRRTGRHRPRPPPRRSASGRSRRGTAAASRRAPAASHAPGALARRRVASRRTRRPSGSSNDVDRCPLWRRPSVSRTNAAYRVNGSAAAKVRSKSGLKSTATMIRAKKAPMASAPSSQPWECPPRRSNGAGEENAATTTSSIDAASRCPPKVRYSFETPSRSTSRIMPQEKSSDRGIEVS